MLLSKMGKVVLLPEIPTENLDISPDSVYNDTVSGIGTERIKCPCRTFAFSEITVILQ